MSIREHTSHSDADASGGAGSRAAASRRMSTYVSGWSSAAAASHRKSLHRRLPRFSHGQCEKKKKKLRKKKRIGIIGAVWIGDRRLLIYVYVYVYVYMYVYIYRLSQRE